MGSKLAVLGLVGLGAVALASGCALVSGLSDVGVCPGARGCDDAGASADGSSGDGSNADVQPADTGVQDSGWEAGPPVPCSTSPGACVASLPPGWSLVTTGGTCPVNFTPGTFVTGATAPPNACSCSCSVTTTPTCPSMFSYSEGGAQCGQALMGATGQCIKLSDHYVQMTAPSPSAGACSANVIAPSPNKTTTFACTPPTACQEELCLGALKLPSCIVHDGTAQCPAPFNTKTTVGTGATVDCSGGWCTCSMSSATCTVNGASYPQGCQSQGVAFAANGQCNALPNDYIKVTLQLSGGTCNPSNASFNGQATLTGTKTLCCR